MIQTGSLPNMISTISFSCSSKGRKKKDKNKIQRNSSSAQKRKVFFDCTFVDYLVEIPHQCSEWRCANPPRRKEAPTRMTGFMHASYDRQPPYDLLEAICCWRKEGFLLSRALENTRVELVIPEQVCTLKKTTMAADIIVAAYEQVITFCCRTRDSR